MIIKEIIPLHGRTIQDSEVLQISIDNLPRWIEATPAFQFRIPALFQYIFEQLAVPA